MRSASSKPPLEGAEAGFTLLEVIITLAIAAMLTTFFVVRFVEESDDEGLRDAASELSVLAQRANRMASAYGEDYRIILDQKGFWMSDQGPAGSGPLEATVRQDMEGQILPKDIALQVRTVGQKEWATPEHFAWVFPAAGLSDPMIVRFSRGKAFVEQTYNPLTSRVAEEHFYFP